MDEETGVKAPVVTRLRRRLSTEAEGAQSPLTPTKKRNTRLAKPALELIDENVTDNVAKKVTSKASAKVTEPVEEKSITPSRRSSRIRSNTSLLMEATQNTVADSPRAKRALRRNSQIGSDTEGPTTPVRRTRARKDSTSSVETLAATSSNEKVVTQVAEAISEEPEKEIPKEKLNDSQNLTPTRKSPRLNKNNKNTAEEVAINEKPGQNDNAHSNTSKLTEDAVFSTIESNSNTNDNTENKSQSKYSETPNLKTEKPGQNNNVLTNTSKLTEDAVSSTIESTSNTNDNTESKSDSKYSEISNLSVDSAKLINEITSSKKSVEFNQTISAIEGLINDKSNRKRTKSWTTITTVDTPSNAGKLASGDSIIEKIYTKSPNKSFNKSESIYNTSVENKENIVLKSPQAMNASDTIKALEKTPIKNVTPLVLFEDSDSNSGNEKLNSDKTDGGDQCVPVIKKATPKRSASESFTVEPMDIDETMPGNVTINDFSDKSNSSKDEIETPNLIEQNSSKLDQSSSKKNKSSKKSTRTSSGTLIQDTTNSKRKSSITSEENNEIKNTSNETLSIKSQRKESISILIENDNSHEKSNRKSSLSQADSDSDKRKSSTSSQIEEKLKTIFDESKQKSISESETQHLEKTENKSTLVLSQLKDVSENEINNVSKSPSDVNNDLSNSVNIPTVKTNQSNYLTSTPLHQKPLQKLAMQINTSVISFNNDNKKMSKVDKTSVQKVSNISNDLDSSEESDKGSKENSKLIDEEAEEANDDYESGDSRDEEEKKYEKDHEITEKGETLETESELSDDTDYDKDSFVVSSDEEDHGLLSGSGDDLTLTDNELKMTAKSKKKFDDRKRKEQKKTSKEMYEARHRLNESEKRPKSKSTLKRIDSSSESEKGEIQSKKRNRLRIDSSQDMTINNSEAQESITVKKKKAKRLLESVYEEIPNEREITVQNQSIVENNDPLEVAIKQEPKTPQADFNMSAVLINDKIEQVQLDTNTTVMKPNETSDPLQSTLTKDDDSDSDKSENMEIQENYNSILANLNKSNNKNKKDKVKTHDASLNLNKNAKKAAKERIMHELNLTQPKSGKKKNKIAKDINSKEQSAKKIQEDDNSDSIDMRLLFPEDSNDSEPPNGNKKPDNNDFSDERLIIPLKRTEAKTNLHEVSDNIGFFIDTKGDYNDSDSELPQNNSKKNETTQKQNVSLKNVEALSESLKKEKKKKKNKSFDVPPTDEEPVLNLFEASARYDQPKFAFEENAPLNVSECSDKKKKKNKSQLDILHITEDAAQEETVQNVPLSSDKKKKKNKSHVDVFQIIEDAAQQETVPDISLGSDKKKKKKKNKSQLDISQIVQDPEPEERPVNNSSSKKKKKKHNSQLDISQTDENTAREETPIDILVNSNKKKSKIKSVDILQAVQKAEEDSDEAPVEVAYKSEKKSENPEPVEDDDTLTKHKNKFKKKKKKYRHMQPADVISVEVKAKKRKHDQSSITNDIFDEEIQVTKSQKKKKLYQHEDAEYQGASTSKAIKREANEDDDIQRDAKVSKKHFFQKIHVPRLPDSIVNQLDDQPTQQHVSKKSKNKQMAISTMPFIVEEGPKRKNKPSNYLETSVYLNDSISPVKQKKKIKNPKVLPFTPTVITSAEGYTSRFKINVLPQETQFIAQANNMTNFREEYLSKQRTKKLRVEHYKKQRDKIRKF